MKILIAEDDLTSRIFMDKYLSKYGECDVAINGMEAIDMVAVALENKNHYNLICLDVMMPKVAGLKVLKTIRYLEKSKLKEEIVPAKIVMTTALNDKATVEAAYDFGCQAYAWKPIVIEEFNKVLEKMELI